MLFIYNRWSISAPWNRISFIIDTISIVSFARNSNYTAIIMANKSRVIRSLRFVLEISVKKNTSQAIRKMDKNRSFFFLKQKKIDLCNFRKNVSHTWSVHKKLIWIQIFRQIPIFLDTHEKMLKFQRWTDNVLVFKSFMSIEFQHAMYARSRQVHSTNNNYIIIIVWYIVMAELLKNRFLHLIKIVIMKIKLRVLKKRVKLLRIKVKHYHCNYFVNSINFIIIFVIWKA